MSVYYSVGNRLLTEEEWLAPGPERGRTLGVEDTTTAKLPDVTPPALRRLGGSPAVMAGAEDFQPTGVGKPLSIWITSAHAGALGSTWWKGSRSVLVTSAIKSWVTPEATPRALNILKGKVKKGEPIGLPAATDPGTPLVFYSPATIDRRLTLTVEFAFDDVDEEMFKGVSGVFDAAGGLPVFAAASPYLLAASALFKIGGSLGNRLFDSRAEFIATEQITLALSDGTGYAGYVVMTRTALERRDLLKGYSVSNEGVLVDANGDPYQGDVPHVVVALDGRADSALEKFAASAVTASMMQKFYNVREDGGTDAKMLTDALGLYNDLRYSNEAKDLRADLAHATGDEKEDLQRRYDAIVKNIRSDAFKPA